MYRMELQTRHANVEMRAELPNALALIGYWSYLIYSSHVWKKVLVFVEKRHHSVESPISGKTDGPLVHATTNTDT